MKRFLAILLSVSLLLVSLFTGIVTAGAESSVLVAVSEKGANWSQGVIGQSPNEWIVNIQDLHFREGETEATAVFKKAIGAIASDRAINFNSDVVEGEKPNFATPCLTLRYLDVASGSEAFMLYVRMPKYYADSNWAVRVNNANIHMSSDDSSTQCDVSLKNTTLKYLEKGSSVWGEAVIDDYGTLFLPSGFEGYIKFDISSAKDTFGNAEYSIQYISFIFGAIGAEYGSFDVGGIYSVTDDSDSSLFNVDGIIYDTTALTSTTVSLENTTKTISGGDAALTRFDIVNGSAAAGASKNVVFSSKNNSVTGPVAGGSEEIMEMMWARIPMTIGVDSFMLYVELPDYEKAGATWALKFSGLGFYQEANGFTGYALAYSDPKDFVFTYIGEGDTAWQQGYIGSDFVLNLPSGFKGYVKFDLKLLPDVKNGVLASKGFDINSEHRLEYLKFSYNAVGGDCGNLVFGERLYSLTNNSYCTTLDIDGADYKLYKDLAPMVATAINADFGAKSISNLANASVQTKHEYPTGSPALGGYQALAFTSLTDDAVSYNAYATDYYSATWPNIVIKAGSDEIFMIYVELPEFAADSWGMKFMYLALQQDGSNYADGYNMLWTNTVGAKVSYMSIYDDFWTDSAVYADGTCGLPSGFKGYVKLDMKTLTDRISGRIGSELDLSKDYKISTVQLGYNNVGGANGDFILGSYYSVTDDSDSNMVWFGESDVLCCMTAIDGDVDYSGIIDANDIAITRRVLVGSSSFNGVQQQRQDANGDGTFNIKDLINLKNKCAA